jgi:ElaB/YqjD/DUF883 family membrane-anchored ribosome-binding protein
MDSVKSALTALKEDLEALRKAVRGSASDGAHAWGDHIREDVNERYEEVRKGLTDLYDRGRKATEGITDHVRRRPLVSLLAAAGTGAVLGIVLKELRRSRR